MRYLKFVVGNNEVARGFKNSESSPVVVGCCEYAVRLDLSNDALFFYEDELEVVK